MDKKIDLQCADAIRYLSVAMVEKAQSGHPGGPMGGADFMHILYSEFLKFDPDDMTWQNRDRFFLDPGHLSAMLYSQLHLLGFYSKYDLESFRQWGSITPGHPEVDKERGIENTSGPLGQGHAMGIGAALAAKFLVERFGSWMDHTLYTYISDGGIQEEISQGVGRIAGFLGLNNLVMFFDSNDVQLSTKTEEVTSEDTAKKYEAWGWKVVTIDGHNHDEIRKALTDANNEKEKPVLIIGKTIMGKGCLDEDGNSFEGAVELHGKPVGKTGASYEKTLSNLGADPKDSFLVSEEVNKHYQSILERKRKEAALAKEAEATWRKDNPTLAKKLDLFLSGKTPSIDYSKIIQKANSASRDASSVVLADLADKVENLIVASADLSNSDKTDGFLRKTTSFSHHNFKGNFLQAGVAEFSMAAMANGMALHGGVIPVVGTFFIFSDYQKPALRLSALMELPVIYLWTHDAFRVGEDGPTHQPIEQEAQIRLMEKLKNHSGNKSFLALRPADAHETTVAWQMALENTHTPTGLILSRQAITDLPHADRYTQAQGAKKGAYVVKEGKDAKIILLGNGSEVSTLFEASDLLEKDGISVDIVSVPSEGLFRSQSQNYQKSVLDSGKFFIGLTAGLPATLESLVGWNGEVIGLDHFGYSAPSEVLDQKFGFTAEEIYKKVKVFYKKLNL